MAEPKTGRLPRASAPQAGPAGTPPAKGLFARPGVQTLITLVLLTAAAGIVYGRAIDTPFIFDDAVTIVGNPSIVHLWPLRGEGDVPGPLNPQHYYPTSGRPLVNLTFAMNYHFGDLNPRGYHLVNMALHVLAAALLAAIVGRTLRLDYFASRFDNVAWPLSIAVALVWTVHPLVTESVVYITQRTELMMGLFYLSTLYCSLRYWSADSRAGRRVWAALGTIACLAGMASKEVMVTAPVVVLLYEWTFFSGSMRERLRRSWPLYAGLALGWLLLLLLNRSGPRADTAGFDLGIPAHVWWMTQARILWIYLKLAVWPWPLVIHYGAPYLETLSAAWPWVLGALIFGVGTLIFLWRRSAIGFVGACVWLILSPTLVVPIITEAAAERRMYLPLAAIVTLLIVGAYQLAVRFFASDARQASGNWLPLGITAATLGLVVLLSLVSVRRLAAYESDVALWEDTLVNQPENPWVHNNLGDSLNAVGQRAEALQQFQQAVQLKSDYAEAHCNLGGLLATVGQVQEAIQHCQEALRLKPEFAQAHGNLGTALLNSGHKEEAIAQYAESLRLRPDLSLTHYNMGNALLAAGRPQDAITHFKKALQLNPEAFESENGLGLALMRTGHPQESIPHFRQAVRIRPSLVEAQYNVGNALFKMGDVNGAINQYKETLKTAPDNLDTLSNLGLILVRTGQPQEAVDYLNRAVQLHPEDAEVQTNVGIALMGTNRPQDAIGHFQRAAQLQPDYAEAWANLAGASAQVNQPAQAIAAAEKAIALARAEGKTALVQQVENWLVTFRGGESQPARLPDSALPPSAP